MTRDEMVVNLWEREAVKKVMLRFGRALDTGDWAAYRSCFTDPVTVDFQRLTGQPIVQVDPDLFTLFASQILAPVRRHHSYSNWDINVEGDHADALVYMTSRHWRQTDFGASENAQYGWYEVRFIKQGNDWLITSLKHDFQWIGGNASLFDLNDPSLIDTMGKLFNEDTILAEATT